ncbi:MAG: GNAT family N-acetyltransferase [Cyclobacteriaceae bacterium]
MIRKINHKEPEQADKIYRVFQRSYPFEGRLLKVPDEVFPPLKRLSGQIRQANSVFYGYYEGPYLAAAVEVTSGEPTKINSFVVDPDYFQQGIGAKMMAFIFDEFPSKKYVVETGRENIPAISLYRKFGFEIVREYPLPQGIFKVVMEKIIK